MAKRQRPRAKSQWPVFFAPTYICRQFPLSGTCFSNFIFASDNTRKLSTWAVIECRFLSPGLQQFRIGARASVLAFKQGRAKRLGQASLSIPVKILWHRHSCLCPCPATMLCASRKIFRTMAVQRRRRGTTQVPVRNTTRLGTGLQSCRKCLRLRCSSSLSS
jgi:hypothetical protein